MNLKRDTANAYRTGFNTMWKHAAPYMTRKGIKKPGEYDKNNVHGGRLYGSRKECKITDKIAGNIIERLYESGKVGLHQLKQVRHSLSYAYYLRTGSPQDNFPEVYAQWKTFDLTKLPPVRKPKKPKRIPTPKNLKLGFTNLWTPEHPWCLADFSTGVLACWDSDVFGLRPNIDIAKVKKSVTHEVNANEGYGWTEMLGGRSKLHGQKTRTWRVYRVCVCKGDHSGPPPDLKLDTDGNPEVEVNWCTVCPVSAMELLSNLQGHHPRMYAKWLPNQGRFGNSNIKNVPGYALKWLTAQGVQGSFDRSCGRKCLSRWLNHLHVPYHESLHIHGDLQSIWRGHYEPKLMKSGNKTREQSTDTDTATAALRRFAKWIHKDGRPPPSLKQRLRSLLEEMD